MALHQCQHYPELLLLAVSALLDVHPEAAAGTALVEKPDQFHLQWLREDGETAESSSAWVRI